MISIDMTSKNYKILESGIVQSFSENSDVTFCISEDDGSEDLFIELAFEKDDTKKTGIESSINKNRIKFIGVNFNDYGTGLSQPVALAKTKEGVLYFRFWSYLLGNNLDQEKTRRIEYTFYIGE